jgi:hypothetical protein
MRKGESALSAGITFRLLFPSGNGTPFIRWPLKMGQSLAFFGISSANKCKREGKGNITLKKPHLFERGRFKLLFYFLRIISLSANNSL